ncbi:MAG: hypothetical protein COA43_04270 [Robiginitomaculum sp.]|nr:MAG: hypothetical protein COA43_04270 [Robiginitomaculum sp.]
MFEIEPAHLVRILDLLGTIVFGISGGVLAIRKKLDMFGVIVLALCAGLAGGVFRDLVIGASPPKAFQHGEFAFAAMSGGLLAFFALPLFSKLERPIFILDAMGLGLFAVSGCSIALSAGLAPMASIVLGVISAIGGGIVRDVLVGRVPVVFITGDIYAFAALGGASLYFGLLKLEISELIASILAVLFVFFLRVFSVRFKWKAPTSPWQ